MRENDMANKISDAAQSKERVQVEEGMLRQALVLLRFLSYKIYQGVQVLLQALLEQRWGPVWFGWDR
jgi:hypothetical protein